MKDYDTANNTDDNIPLQEDEDTAEVMRIAEELKRIQEEEDEEEGRGWDGSEAELVEDDDAEEYEIPMAGIRVSYVLPRRSISNVLNTAEFINLKEQEDL